MNSPLPAHVDPNYLLPPMRVLRVRFTAQMAAPIQWANHPGSVLRSAFGKALRERTCLTGAPDCQACPETESCAYALLFDAQSAVAPKATAEPRTEPPQPQPDGSSFQQRIPPVRPNPYVIEPPEPDDPGERDAPDALRFHMVLIGPALELLALVIEAWQLALAHGLDKARVQGDLLAVDAMTQDHEAISLWADGEACLDYPIDPWLVVPNFPSVRRAHLILRSPMQLRRDNQVLHERNINAQALVNALTRRIGLINQHYGSGDEVMRQRTTLGRVASELDEHRRLQWQTMSRYSARQERTINLGGVQGLWTFQATDDQLDILLPWLWLGQWLHIGKHCVMGYGGYELAVSM